MTFDLEQLFKGGGSIRANFLSRVFGIFSEEIVRIWCRDSRSPFVDEGRPTVKIGDRSYTLDFALVPAGESLPLVTEMKCEIAYEGFRYLRLNRLTQLDHHRGKPAFDAFLEVACDSAAPRVNIGGQATEVAGAALVWGAVDPAAKQAIMRSTGLAAILSLEDMIHDL